ncbi:TIGR02530 family flagellar biosynthesis protein [Desulforamulus ferrireducens]|uniref:TIGR02530 family flagellar biosynthesis protein n=1 Tax=Desulforamulus ferrireducens TaxID=1833852 RepID=UPI0015CFDC5F
MKTEQAEKLNQPRKLNRSGKNNPLNNVSFEELLHREVNRQQEIKFSAHAEKRLKERNIALSEQDFAKINRAVQQAAAKGSRDSLLLYGDMALVTSITNRTIITAIDSKSMEDHVFTNIDSAVIIK